MNSFSQKPKLESVVKAIYEIDYNPPDKDLEALQKEVQKYYKEFKEKYPGPLELELDDEPAKLDLNDSNTILAWFVVWMGKFHIKLEFMPNLCLIVCKIMKILEELGLTIKDLDNKIVWRKVLKECSNLNKGTFSLGEDQEGLNIIIQNVCKMIEKQFPGEVDADS